MLIKPVATLISSNCGGGTIIGFAKLGRSFRLKLKRDLIGVEKEHGRMSHCGTQARSDTASECELNRGPAALRAGTGPGTTSVMPLNKV